MRTGFGHTLAALALLAGIHGTAIGQAPARPAPPPAEAFFGNQEIGDTALSPSGRWLAVVSQPAGARRGLAIIDLQGQEAPRAIAGFSDIDIDDVWWVGEERLVFDLYDANRGGADQRYGPGLYAVKRDGSELKQLVLMEWRERPSAGTRAHRMLDITHRLMHVPATQVPGAETVIVYGQRKPDNWDGDGNLKRLNIVTGQDQPLAVDHPQGGVSWRFDREGEPRLAISTFEGKVTVLERETDATGALRRGWRPLVQGPAYAMPWRLEGRDDQGRIYVSVAQRGGDVLKHLDPVSKEPEAQPLVSVPGFDFDGWLVKDPDGGPLLGLRVTTDAETTVWRDPAMAELQKAIDARLPDRVNRLVCRRCREADRTVLVTSYADRHPGEIWLWRGEAEKPSTWRRVGVKRPAIDPRRMATADLTRFKARDGREIPLWVTLPAEPLGPGPAPAVLLAHGGPWSRGGEWEWDPLAQFMASRGYVVLMPEFRGSMGYGDAHFRAGFKQWGRAMQDDLADAVGWAVERKLVDPRRVCIVGGSYGGYAALMGLVKQPEVFRCAAAFAAVTEPFWLLREGSPDIRSSQVSAYTLPQMVGDTVADADALREASPLQHAARIRGPLLLAWGDEDRRVPPEHSQRLSAALKAAGIAHEAAVYAGEGHSWLKTASWVDFAGRLERLLARELQGTAARPAN